MSSRFGNCSYQYLSELKEDYALKLRDTNWEWLHPLIQEELYAVEYRLHTLGEQELCMKFQEGKISQSILQSLNSDS